MLFMQCITLRYMKTDKIDCFYNNLQSFGNESFYEEGFNNTPFSDRLAIVKAGNMTLDFTVQK